MNDIFSEFEHHLLNDEKPSIYFNSIMMDRKFKETFPFKLLGVLKDVPQSLLHHPEGNVWNHTMLVLDEAAKVKENSKDKRVFMWAALLHDVGKTPATKTRKGKITAYDHDKMGETLTIEFLEVLTEDEVFIYEVSKLVRWHMQTLFVVKNMPFSEIEKMLKETDLDEVALLSLCDRLGRGGMTKDKIIEEKNNIRIFMQKSVEKSDK